MKLKSPTKEQVIHARRILGYTQAECAALVDSPPPRWCEWENGRYRMNARTWTLFLERTGLEIP